MRKSFSKLVTGFLLTAFFCSLFIGMIPAPSAFSAGETFTVGFDAEFPPYGYKDENGEYVGFDLEMQPPRLDAQKAAHRLGQQGYGA